MFERHLPTDIIALVETYNGDPDYLNLVAECLSIPKELNVELADQIELWTEDKISTNLKTRLNQPTQPSPPQSSQPQVHTCLH